MTKAFYFWKICNKHIIKNRAKKGTLPKMICFSWIKCHKICNVFSGIPQSEINKGLLEKRNGPTKQPVSFYRVV